MKVDVGLQVYGKPYNTLVTLESLMVHCEQWIDKIYLVEEAEHPYNDNIKEIFNYDYPIVHKKLNRWVNIYGTKSKDVPKENIRHQWIIENAKSKYLFICHNDVLFTGDVIGNMLNLIADNVVGISEIGQCWNCPALSMCGGGEKWNDWNPSFEDINNLSLPHIRTRKDNLDKDIPKLMPECRLNEWACLIDRELCIQHPTPYFGSFDDDSGTEWFKTMNKRGYKFIDYRKDFIHGYFTPDRSGYNAQQVESKYRESERLAKQYFEENYAE